MFAVGVMTTVGVEHRLVSERLLGRRQLAAEVPHTQEDRLNSGRRVTTGTACRQAAVQALERHLDNAAKRSS
jgi:hypothetical protein